MDREFYQKRREALFGRLAGEKAVVILSSGYSITKSADENYDFQVNTNFFYLTGVEQEQTCLLLQKDGNTFRTLLFIDEYDEMYAKWIGHRLTPEEATEITGLDVSEIRYKSEFEKTLAILAEDRERVFYLDLEKRENVNYNSFGLSLAERLDTEYKITPVDAYPLLVSLRSSKDKGEVVALQKAIEATGEGIEAMMTHARPGDFEYQLEAWFDYTVKANGNHRYSFKTIAAAGANATTLHYSANNTVMQDGDLILFDLGVKQEGYCADISRTFPVNGRFTPLQRKIYEIVLMANKKIAEVAKAGMTIGELQKITVDLMAEACVSAGLLETKDEIQRVYFHSVSHSIGLDTHDPLNHKEPLPEGAVISDEPGLYFPEHGIGVRIEDDLLLTADGAVNLSAGIPKEVDEIEALMAGHKA